MPKPILCFDLDGTLVNNNGEIHPKDIQFLSAKQPPAFFIASTGRSLDSVRKIFNQNSLFKAQKIPFPLVLQNGAQIFGPGEVQWRFSHFDPDTQSTLLNIIQSFPSITFLLFGEKKVFIQHPNPFGLTLTHKYQFSPQSFSSADMMLPLSKLMCMSSNQQELADFSRAIKTLKIEAAFSMETIFEIAPNNVNKGQGVKHVLGCIHREKDRFFAAGDGGNDIPLLRLAARSFAPTSAPEEVKLVTDDTVDVKENGLIAIMLLKIS